MIWARSHFRKPSQSSNYLFLKARILTQHGSPSTPEVQMHRETIKFVLLPNRKPQQNQQLWNSGNREEYRTEMFPNTEGSMRESWRPMGPKNDIPWSGIHSPGLAAGMHRKTRKSKALRVATNPSTMTQPSSHNRASNHKNNKDFRVPFDLLTFHKTSETSPRLSKLRCKVSSLHFLYGGWRAVA